MIAPATQLCLLNRGSTNPSGISLAGCRPGRVLSLLFPMGTLEMNYE